MKNIFKIQRSEFDKIKATVGTIPAESGGLLLGRRDDNIVTHFEFDSNGKTSGAAYSPDTKFCNKIIKKARKGGLDFIGMCHSHPTGLKVLSGSFGDIGYIQKIFKAMPSLDCILVPIIQSSASGEFEFIPYKVFRENPEQPILCQLEIVEDMVVSSSREYDKVGLKDTSRLEGAVDLEMLKSQHITFVGCGGASEIVIDMVRSGIENFTLIDFDHVSHSNLTTQGFTRKQADDKTPKVLAVKEYAEAINPDVNIETYVYDFTRLDKDLLEAMAQKTTLWMFMCDKFEPHKLGQELVERFPTKAIFAGMYDKSLACEIVYYIPEGRGTTPATYRSIHGDGRYKFFASGGEVPKTLIGTTVFHSHYLNTVIGMLGLALMHNEHNKSDYIMGEWFDEVSHHNLIQFRLHPTWSSEEGNLFKRTYPTAAKEAHGGKVFEALWRYVPPAVSEEM
jgi:proteasome lid subunit RPN8/RPN11